MSSVVDGLLHSDNIDLDIAAGRRTNDLSNGRRRQRSSPRPSGAPSESNGAFSDVEGFPDDEVVGLRGTDRNRPRNPMERAVPKVVDQVGEKVAEEFENFLEKYKDPCLFLRWTLTCPALSRISHCLVLLHRAL